MDTSLKKPLSLKISSQCSGLEAAGNLCEGAEVSDVPLCIFSVGTTDAPKWHAYLSCQQSHILRVSALAAAMPGLSGRALDHHKVLPRSPLWEPFLHFHPVNSSSSQAARPPGEFGMEHWNLNACSWCFINQFNFMKLPTSLGCTVGAWELSNVADAKTY